MTEFGDGQGGDLGFGIGMGEARLCDSEGAAFFRFVEKVSGDGSGAHGRSVSC